MPHWNRTIDLKPERKQYAAGEISAAEYAQRTARKIKESGWIGDTPYPDTLRDHIEYLEGAASAESVDAAMDPIYDVADEDRVWIETS